MQKMGKIKKNNVKMLSLCVHYELCTGERAGKKCARLLHFWGKNQQQ